MTKSIFENYKDYNYINALIFNNLYKIPQDIDAIVGIPRSGMLTSTIVSEFKNLPITDIFSFVSGNVDTFYLNGPAAFTNVYDKNNVKHILLVDDTMGAGSTMNNSLRFIKDKYHNKNLKITTFVTFVEPYSTDKVDIYCEVMRYQFMPYSILKRGIPSACVDIDGVLTENVPPEYDTDDERYIHFLENQRQIYVPQRPIKMIVTSRLSKYKEITEEWLKKHNIEYECLVMLGLENKIDRDRINVGEYKAKVYSDSGLGLFIESDLNEAKTIKSITGKPVFCTQICNMI